VTNYKAMPARGEVILAVMAQKRFLCKEKSPTGKSPLAGISRSLSLPSATAVCERREVILPGHEESPKATMPVAQRLVKTEHEQIVPNASLGEQRRHYLSPRDEQFDRVLCVVVVPWHSVVVEEGEQLIPVFQNSAPVVPGNLRLVLRVRFGRQKLVHVALMFAKMVPLQAEPVDCADYWLKDACESRCYLFQFFIERVLQQVVI
jgi:hypothetical protein